jgi:hypothetical protein
MAAGGDDCHHGGRTCRAGRRRGRRHARFLAPGTLAGAILRAVAQFDTPRHPTRFFRAHDSPPEPHGATDRRAFLSALDAQVRTGDGRPPSALADRKLWRACDPAAGYAVMAETDGISGQDGWGQCLGNGCQRSDRIADSSAFDGHVCGHPTNGGTWRAHTVPGDSRGRVDPSWMGERSARQEERHIPVSPHLADEAMGQEPAHRLPDMALAEPTPRRGKTPRERRGRLWGVPPFAAQQEQEALVDLADGRAHLGWQGATRHGIGLENLASTSRRSCHIATDGPRRRMACLNAREARTSGSVYQSTPLRACQSRYCRAPVFGSQCRLAEG